jgi:hypothetical protein
MIARAQFRLDGEPHLDGSARGGVEPIVDQGDEQGVVVSADH